MLPSVPASFRLAPEARGHYRRGLRARKAGRREGCAASSTADGIQNYLALRPALGDTGGLDGGRRTIFPPRRAWVHHFFFVSSVRVRMRRRQSPRASTLARTLHRAAQGRKEAVMGYRRRSRHAVASALAS